MDRGGGRGWRHRDLGLGQEQAMPRRATIIVLVIAALLLLPLYLRYFMWASGPCSISRALERLPRASIAEAAELPCPFPKRSQAAVAAFKRANPCPPWCQTYIVKDGAIMPYERCGACEVDHVCPLACCGADEPANMQYLLSRDNRAKGADCGACPVR